MGCLTSLIKSKQVHQAQVFVKFINLKNNKNIEHFEQVLFNTILFKI